MNRPTPLCRQESFTPSYRRQARPSGLDDAFVELNGKRIYLGPYDAPESREKYHRLIAEWEAAGRALPVAPHEITVAEIAAQYITFAKTFYIKHGHETAEPGNVALAIRPLNDLYGSTPAAHFGPKALKTVIQRMIAKGWTRKQVNRQLSRVKRIFKWAVAEELIPPGIYEGLRAVSGLRCGRCGAPDNPPVAPAPPELVEGVKRHVSRQVRAMIDLQLLTGARPGEIVIMRPCDIDRSEEIWVYRPAEHKTEHHGRDRLIFVGPKAQEVLAPFLLREPQSYCFSPREAEKERYAEASERRKTALSCGNVPQRNVWDHSARILYDHYNNDSYRRAIDRAIERAFPPAEPLAQRPGESERQWRARLTPDQKEAYRQWVKQHHWHPHQLRHSYGTMVRKEEKDLEAAQIMLGHSKADVTQVYAERDMERAKRIARKVG